MTLQTFQVRVSGRLLAWSIFSILSGMLMLRRPVFWRKVGIQFISWGMIDALIAVGGQFASDKRLRDTSSEELPEQLRKDKRNLRIALWVNSGLDILYIWSGLRWMRRGSDAKGSGIGVIIQGLFLLVFDLYHAFKIQSVDTPSD